MFEALEKAKREIEAARAKLKESFDGAMKAAFKDVFAAHPDLLAIRWRQYTPYFNDACVFRVDEWSSKMIDTAEDAEDNYGDEGFTSSLGYPHAAVKAAVESLFELFDDDSMRDAFGDHAMITATREGFAVDEYEHE